MIAREEKNLVSTPCATGELPTDTMPGTTPARELASSAVMSFCMNNIAVEIALATPLIERVTGTTPDHTQLLLTFIFINLCFFFGPFYGKASGGACNNPTVYFLFWLLGEIPGGAAAVGFVCTIVGTAIGTVGYGLLLDALPMAGYTGITAVKAAAGPVHGALAEAAVAFTNFLFAGLIQPMFGDVMAPYAGADGHGGAMRVLVRVHEPGGGAGDARVGRGPELHGVDDGVRDVLRRCDGWSRGCGGCERAGQAEEGDERREEEGALM
jgi:hypothetical protein